MFDFKGNCDFYPTMQGREMFNIFRRLGGGPIPNSYGNL